MGRIKSALEIALEKTESIKSDKASISQFDTKQKGKKIANEYLGDPKKSLEDEIKKCPKAEKESLKQGIFDVLSSQLALPGNEEDMTRIESAARGMQTVLNENRFSSMVKQFLQILRQYLNEAAQYEEAIKRQYAPKLRQKEEELSRRLGRQVSLDPFQDPEFVAFFNQNMNALKENYQGAVDQLRESALEFMG
jgi:predicted component of type VI protein secretion system